MPIYEYRCEACGEAFDKFIRSLNKMPADIFCPACHSSEVQRLMSAPVVHSGGAAGGESFDTIDTTPATPPVFGRKELNAAQEKKRQLKEKTQYEAKAAKKKST